MEGFILSHIYHSAVFFHTGRIGAIHCKQTVEIAGALFLPRGTRFQKEDIGREVALLPCEEGFLILCITEGG